ncbi:hypothetical protein FTX61_06645 [Nitriliruptoraceae bacterium ZYF776]|nr:hypothetical protein [Profundirhabdus halotolerans]
MSVPFICNVPVTASAADPSAPLLYGHGLLGTKREGNGGSTVRLRERNFTVCSVDWAGMSEFDQLVVAGILQEASGMPIMADRLQQAHLNFAYVGRALIHPEGLAAQPAFQDGDGQPLIDVDAPLSYDGNSQGGIMGGATVALSPDIQRGVLGVPGMNYSTLLNRSLAFEQRELGAIYNANYPDPIERQLGFGLLQMLWDRGENNGYAHATTTSPLPNTPAKEVLLQVAFGDHLVTPLAAEVQARAYGARLLQTSLAEGRHWSDDPAFGLGVFDVDGDGAPQPHTGSALVYFDSGNSVPPSVNLPPVFDGEVDPHEDPRRDQLGADQRRTFLLTGVVEDVRDGAPYWTVECRGPFNPVACG